MRILLLGADTPVGQSLRAFIPPLQRHELLLADLDATRWKRERQAKKLLKSSSPDLVLDARMISLIDSNLTLGQPELERTEWLASLGAKLGYQFLVLSSSRVFSGNLSRPYRETDEPDATDPRGSLLIATEQTMLQQIEPVFLLRLGWVFSGRGPSALKSMLDRLKAGESLSATDRRKDCPVHTAEVARVVAGVIDQLSVGAPARGIYHYGSDGDASYFAFCEAVVACASQFEIFADATELVTERVENAALEVNRSLDCTAIRHQFGIQRRPWRDFIERAVRRYIELYCKEDPQ